MMAVAETLAEPSVSIIMPSFNSAEFIGEAIESVLAQTHRSWELLVVDDCSRDDTRSIIASYGALDDRIRPIFLQENSGSAVARNTAIAETRGRYIAFLDSDDIWAQQKLERQLAFMTESGCPFTYTSYERISEEGRPLSIVRVPPATTFRSLLRKNVVACLTAIYDTAFFGRTLMPDIRKGQDYGLWLALLRRVDHGCGLDEVLGRYRVRENSISSNKFESSQWVWRIYREVVGLSLPAAIVSFTFYAAGGIWDRVIERVPGRDSG